MAKQSYEAFLAGREIRRYKVEAKHFDKLDRQMTKADTMIGQLMRDGKTVFYVHPNGGRYKEGTRHDLINYLIRNRWV